jgi:5-methylcytosine-specific restriction endonuclease McrA
MKKPVQRVLHCPCGNAKVLAKGLCPTCYTLKRQDEEYFGGHREEVLKRDDYRCRVPGCTTLKRGKRSVAVHHREPGNSDPEMMLTLCLACHAKVTRTLYVQDDWPEFLRVLWREQHPDGHEQVTLDFSPLLPLATAVPLFEGIQLAKRRRRSR